MLKLFTLKDSTRMEMFETFVKDASSSIQLWKGELDQLIQSCKQVSDAHRDLDCLGSANFLPFDIDLHVWTNSLKCKLGSALENSFEAMNRLRTASLNVLERIESLEIVLCPSIGLPDLPDNWAHISNCLSLLNRFRTELANECDAIGLYHLRAVFKNDDSHSPSVLPPFDPNLSVIWKLWMELYLPVLRTAVHS
ncbi:hypothetical protein FGIG_07461 [Fasciola gigantica]|uniref:Uncharacterized protein n=1 Tax=Fasciola gigantica TaxID=46835 RepID=A0A504YYD1_FASGI|nr:hypothetical protein FGIG_07461 [Fasciola gigantica]